jgi:group I intron endonuclease
MPRKKHKYHYIYKTTNLINGKYYIGMHSTSNLEDGYLGSGNRIRRSIKIYGKENFKCEILEMLPDRDSLKEREKELVNEDILKDKMCMNLQLGGGGGFVNDEHKQKFLLAGTIAAAKSGKNNKRRRWLFKNDTEWSEKCKNNLSNSLKGRSATFKGKKHKDDSKRKIGLTNSIKQSGEKNSQFGTCWITNGEINKKISKTDKLPNGWNLGRTVK